ncbi:MAG: hypothetical protein CM15mP109_01600 [Candidatus Dadabacteria bacterium]|nr:MAG: hypothetical protein CM15mP109_01600 [Candidatus Dadabacteria bacterium]
MVLSAIYGADAVTGVINFVTKKIKKVSNLILKILNLKILIDLITSLVLILDQTLIQIELKYSY